MRRSAPLAQLVALLMVTGTVALGGCVTVNVPKTPVTAPAEKPVTAEKPASGFAVGDSVAALWTDGSLYLATVTGTDGDQITVKYADDGSTKTVAATDIKPITKKTWVVGDKVLAVWASGRFYKGSVIEVAGSTYKIKWDDGSAASDVSADKIVAQ
ncbi:MAG: hypothetical protein WCJ13_01930 [Coriobacteriia bacterium]